MDFSVGPSRKERKGFGDIISVRHRDGKAFPLLPAAAEHIFHAVHLLEYASRTSDEFLSARSESHPLRTALKNRSPERGLKLFDRAAQCGLTDIKLFRRLIDRLRFCDGYGVFHMK